MGKVGYDLLASRPGAWSLILNAGGGAMVFDIDVEGLKSYTYPAINAGAKIGYAASDRIDLYLNLQGDIAFTKEDELGTKTAWVWPFSAGVAVSF